MKRYRGILFDLGGTLFEHQSAASARRNLSHAARRFGIEAEPAHMQRRLSEIRAGLEREFLQRPFFLHRELVARTIEEFARSYARTPDPEVVDEYCDRQRDTVVRELQLREDCLATLAALRRRVDYLAIVSNIDDDYLLPLLERTGLEAYFDHTTSSEAARACKPSPTFFMHALELGGLQARETLFVGDSLAHDVAGAAACALDAAWLTDTGEDAPDPEPQPTYTIKALADLLAITR